MADESQNTRVFMEKEEALQVICAALQGGALKLPFATEFHDHIKKPQEDLKFETFFRGIQYPIDGRNECVTGGEFDGSIYGPGLFRRSLLADFAGCSYRRNQ